MRRSFSLKSVSTCTPVKRVRAGLLELGFELVCEATTVSDERFWRKSVFSNGEETVAVSDEIGAVVHLRDPVVTICGRRETIAKVSSLIHHAPSR